MNTVRPLLLLSISVMIAACEIDQEKIDLWKTTENGPKKLAGAMIDPEQAMEIRVMGAIALIELNSWDLYREAFQKMDKADAQKVIAALAPKLGEISRGENAGKAEQTPSKKQIDAKDGLFLLLDIAGPENRDAVEKPLVAWCVEGNYNRRAMAGYNIRAIVKKIGAPAALELTKLLNIDQIAIEPIAKLIRDVNDPAALAAASAHVAAQLRGNVAQIQDKHLIAAAVVGGDDVASALLDLATEKNLDVELQRFALRAYSQSIDTGYIKPDRAQIDRLFAMAENPQYDKRHREETYLTLSQAGGKDDVPRIAKLLESEDPFWRLTGMRCVLRIDGEGQLAMVLRSKGLATDTENIDAVIGWIAKFPKLLPAVRELLQGDDVFSRAVAVYVLGMKGEKATDVPALEKLASDKAKLPAGFDHGTLGDAAKAALEGLAQKKGSER
jgi:hypothetical protein